MRRFSDLQVGKRLAVGFLTTGLLFIGASAISLRASGQQTDALTQVDNTSQVTKGALELKFQAADVNGWQTAYALDVSLGTPNATDDSVGSRKAFLASATAFSGLLDELGALPLTADEAAELTTARTKFDEFMALDQKVIAGYRLGTPEATAEANAWVLGEEITIFGDMADAVQAIGQRAADAAVTAVANAKSDADAARTQVLAGLVAAIAASIFLALVISRSIGGPLRKLRARLVDIAEGDGDLTARLDEDRRDEMGDVGRAFNVFVAKIADAIRTISGHSVVIAASSEELSAVSRQMAGNAADTAHRAGTSSAAAEEVSLNVQAVAAATEEMTAVISEIARNAQDAAGVAAQAMDLAGLAEGAVQRLGRSSAQIDDVARLIGGIAEQTNLLALNATIEAARAGEAGKGFAVVATEVKDLATRSGGATADIGRQVTLIQQDVRAAVDAISQIVDVIRTINESQSTVAAAVHEQTATTNEISRNLVHVSGGSDVIAADINTVARSAHEAAQGAGDTEHAAIELSKLSSDLQALVSQFRT